MAVLQVLKQDRSPLLYSLVFGEGVINDATAVALLRAVQVSQRAAFRFLNADLSICIRLGPVSMLDYLYASEHGSSRYHRVCWCVSVSGDYASEFVRSSYNSFCVHLCHGRKTGSGTKFISEFSLYHPCFPQLQLHIARAHYFACASHQQIILCQHHSLSCC